MKNFFNSRLWAWIEADRNRTIRVLFLLLPSVYMLNVLIDEFSCRNGLLACGMHDFAVVFPFYLIVSQFALRVNYFFGILLYLISVGIYLYVFYYIIEWIQESRLRAKSRPRFILKRI